MKELKKNRLETRINVIILALVLCFTFGATAFAGLYTADTSPAGHWPTAATEWTAKTAGTPQAPYVIATSNDLAGLAKLCDEGNTFENKFLVLAADIDLGNQPWEPIGWFTDYLYNWNTPFNGTFDGRGYEISGLLVEGVERDGALFGYIGKRGTVRNLRLKGRVNSPGSSSVGAAVLTAWLDGIAENCVVEGDTVAGSGGYRSYSGIVASLIGVGTARNIVTFGSVESNNGLSYAGGVIGYAYGSAGSVENCAVEAASLKALQDAGGIIGGNLGNYNIYNCVSTAGSVSAPLAAGITAIGATGENNFWLKENADQPEYAGSYGGSTDAGGRAAARGDLPIVAAAPLRVTRVSRGKTINISTDLYPQGGDPAGITFEWKTAGPSVAAVEHEGGPTATVTGVGVGSTTVTLTMSNPAWKGRGRISMSSPVYVTEAYEGDEDPDAPIDDLPDPGVEPGEPMIPDDSEDPEDGEPPFEVEPGENEVTVVKGTDSAWAANVSGLSESLFETDSDGNLVFNSVEATVIAQETWPGEKIFEVKPLPVVWTGVGAAGAVARMEFKVKGGSLLADRPEDVRVMKIMRGGLGGSFTYAQTNAERDGKLFTIMKGGHVHTGEIKGDDEYTLVLFVKDGSEFDLDNSSNKLVLDPAVIVKNNAARPSNDGGGGCGVVSGSMLTAAAALLILRRKALLRGISGRTR